MEVDVKLREGAKEGRAVDFRQTGSRLLESAKRAERGGRAKLVEPSLSKPFWLLVESLSCEHDCLSMKASPCNIKSQPTSFTCLPLSKIHLRSESDPKGFRETLQVTAVVFDRLVNLLLSSIFYFFCSCRTRLECRSSAEAYFTKPILRVERNSYRRKACDELGLIESCSCSWSQFFI